LTTDPPRDRPSDAALLQRFATVRDELAFAELMSRHGPMVLATCLRMLRNRQDAEDAYQAVFVTLSARARALRRMRSLAGWLHNVAVRVSYGVLRANRRRQKQLLASQDHRSEPKDDRLAELREVLDEELTALPARVREAVVLCDLEGYTRQEAAQRLGAPAGTVASRLLRGRTLLRDRLVRRGVTVSAGGLSAVLSRLAEAAPQVSEELAKTTVRQSELFLAGKSAAGLPAGEKIGSLAQGVLHAMFLSKLSTTVCVVALAAVLVFWGSPLAAILGARSEARAQSNGFLDTFDDRNATDGSPVSWDLLSPWSNASVDASSGDFVLQSLPGTPRSVVAIVRDHFLFDTSVQARVSANGANDGVLVGARGDPQIGAYWAGVSSGGLLQITKSRPNEYHVLRSTPSTLVPTNDDVVIQFDVIGTQLSLYAWRPIRRNRCFHNSRSLITNTRVVLRD
jgi:RNA polymerase sigma factor (sigma-70 family)